MGNEVSFERVHDATEGAIPVIDCGTVDSIAKLRARFDSGFIFNPWFKTHVLSTLKFIDGTYELEIKDDYESLVTLGDKLFEALVELERQHGVHLKWCKPRKGKDTVGIKAGDSRLDLIPFGKIEAGLFRAYWHTMHDFCSNKHVLCSKCKPEAYLLGGREYREQVRNGDLYFSCAERFIRSLWKDGEHYPTLFYYEFEQLMKGFGKMTCEEYMHSLQLYARAVVRVQFMVLTIALVSYMVYGEVVDGIDVFFRHNIEKLMSLVK